MRERDEVRVWTGRVKTSDAGSMRFAKLIKHLTPDNQTSPIGVVKITMLHSMGEGAS